MDYFLLSLYLIAALVPSVCFLYVRVALFDKVSLCLKMVAGCVGCIALNCWFRFVYFLTTESLPVGFNIGLLGLVGAFVFFLGANLMPRDDSDMAKAIGAFRLTAIAYMVVYLAMVFARLAGSDAAYLVALVASIVVSGLIIPCTVREASKWKA